MSPMYDRSCSNPTCPYQRVDSFEPVEAPTLLCPSCGAPTQRVWLPGSTPAVIPDEIPGGILIRHGLCDPITGDPVRYYSKSEMVREAKRRGLVNMVRHVPGRDGDKNPHTSSWAAVSKEALEGAAAMLERIHPTTPSTPTPLQEEPTQDATPRK